MSLATAYRRRGGGAHAPARSARLLATLHHGSLDRRIVSGDDAGGDATLDARRWQLTRRRSCERIAAQLEDFVLELERPQTPHIATVPMCRSAVLAAREELLGVAARLREPRPAHPSGVVLLRRLLSDGAGPFYNPRSDRELWRQLRHVADALE
jgi:hypothetical protein